MSLEELAALKVTSVSKKSESLHGTPAAISVITGEDIRRSGAQTLPDALRLSPGTEVAQVDSHAWAVTVRGFNDVFAQKLLVLMDGRSIYNQLFSGVLWHAQDTMLEDLDRIEVIRGPGGTLWGANAVNGVINIVSKSARDTQGWLISAGGGTLHQALASFRYGGKISDDLYFRVYGKFDDWGNTELVTGGDTNDKWWKGQGGFRLDWEPGEGDRFTLQADGFGLEAEQTVPQITLPSALLPPPPFGYMSSREGQWRQSGGNLLGRWTHDLSSDSDFSIQVYYDRSQLDVPVLEESIDTFDLDLRHRFQLGSRNEIVWGGGYRLSAADASGTLEIDLIPNERTDEIYNAFIQDEITLIPERLRWTLGTKVEHNDYTGMEWQPSTRLAWTPSEKQTIWASVARAVRVPSQVEHNGIFTLAAFPANPPTQPFPVVVQAQGNTDFESEELLAYELGYRWQMRSDLTLDLAAFVNDYDNLRRSNETMDFSTLPNYVTIFSPLSNEGQGQTQGGELALTWQATDWWRLRSHVNYIEAHLKSPPSSLATLPSQISISSPQWQIALRSSMELGWNCELDAQVRYVDEIESAGVPIPGADTSLSRIPSYVTFDLRLAWRPTANLEVALIGQNLAGKHREFVPTYISTQFTEVPASVFGKVTWKF